MNVIDNQEQALLVSAEIADWSRPSAVTSIGDKARNSREMLCKPLVVRRRFWSVVTAADIPLNCDLLIPHPNGTVLRPDAKIGVNVWYCSK